MEEETKKVLKVIKKIIFKVLFALFKVIIIIAMPGIILLAAFNYFLTLDDGEYKANDLSSTPYAAETYINDVKPQEDGTLKTETSAQDLWDRMTVNGSRVDKYLDTPEELAILMKAEIVTKYPDTRKNPEEEIDWENIKKEADTLQGMIKFKREDENGTVSTLIYESPDTFDKWIEEYNKNKSESAKKNALSHFTLKKDENQQTEPLEESIQDLVEKSSYYKVVVATLEETKTTIKGNDPEVENGKTEESKIKTTDINYEEMTKPYTMPFDLLWSFLVVGEDKEFALALANLVYGSEIEIVIYDNTTQITETNEWHRNTTNNSEETKEYQYTKTIESKINTVTPAITKADVWIVDYENNNIQKQENETEEKETITKENAYDEVNRKIKTKTYIIGTPTIKEKTEQGTEEENFVTLFNDIKFSKSSSNILNVTSWLFDLIEKNDKTKDMLDTVKYLLYKATNGEENYGVTSLNEKVFYPKQLQSVGEDDYTVHIDKSSKDIVITDIEILKNAFKEYGGDEQLQKYAQDFLNFQNKYKVNAVFVAAVSITETKGGREGCASDGKNNWFNMECTCGSSHGKFETYPSAKESIEEFYQLIANKQKFKVSEIGEFYCKDETNLEVWIENTVGYMNQMFQVLQ